MMVGGYDVIGREEYDAAAKRKGSDRNSQRWVQLRQGRWRGVGRREDGPVAGILTGELGGYDIGGEL